MSEHDDRGDEAPADAAEEERMIRIMQYCDGVLAPREAAAIAEEIARDPEAARLAEEFALGAKAAKRAWSGLDAGPVPLGLARRVAHAARMPITQKHPRRIPVGWRMAAALAIGGFMGALGLSLIDRGSGDHGLRLAGVGPASTAAVDRSWTPALMTALGRDPETARITFTSAAGHEDTIAVSRWFDTQTGLRCAEFVRSASGAADTGGIACRKSDGGWDIIEQER